jgi:drug/metabolite transporter (DMT)-like permease
VPRSALPRIALLALIWGSAFLWIKLADRGFSAVEVTLARLALGAAVLFIIVRVRREPVPRSGRLWAQIAVAALFANAVPYLLFAVAEQTVDSSTAGIINATTPLWTVVLALAVRHQKSVTGWQAAGLVAGFAGAVLIFTPWHTAGGLLSAGGLECLAASVSYAVSYIYMDRYLARRGIGPVVLSACQLAAAAVMLAVALGISGVQTPHVTAENVAAIAVLGIIGTGFAYVLNYQIITSEGATVASTVTYLLPVVAIVLGVLVLGETVTVTTLAGIALVLAGVALTRRRVGQGQAGQETGPGDPAGNDTEEGTKMRRRQREPRAQQKPRVKRVGPQPDREAERGSFPADEKALEGTNESMGPGQVLDGPPDQPRMQASYGHTSSSNYESGPTGSPERPHRPAAGEDYPPSRGPRLVRFMPIYASFGL